MGKQPSDAWQPFSYRPGRRDDLPPLIRIDARTLAYFAVMLVLLWLAGWLYLRQTSEVALYSHEIRALLGHKEQLRRDMIVLRADIAQAGSLQSLQAAAVEWGYTLPAASDPRRQLRLVVPVAPTAPAAAPLAATPTPPQAAPQPDAGRGNVAGWMQTLRQWVQGWGSR